jgi:hypothetical protein
MEGFISLKLSSTSSSMTFNEHIHYSGYQFFNISSKGGSETFPSPSGSIETGHEGNGCIRIKYISEYSCKQIFEFKFQYFSIIF